MARRKSTKNENETADVVEESREAQEVVEEVSEATDNSDKAKDSEKVKYSGSININALIQSARSDKYRLENRGTPGASESVSSLVQVLSGEGYLKGDHSTFDSDVHAAFSEWSSGAGVSGISRDALVAFAEAFGLTVNRG